MDREERKSLLIPLVVSDNGNPSLSATVTLTLVITDVNDNPMKPAMKTVIVNTLQVNIILLFEVDIRNFIYKNSCYMEASEPK